MADQIGLQAIVAYKKGIAYRQTSPFYAHRISVKEFAKLVLAGGTKAFYGVLPLPGRYILTNHKEIGHEITTNKALKADYTPTTTTPKPGWSAYLSNMHWVAYTFNDDFTVGLPTGNQIFCPKGHFFLDGVWEYKVVGPKEMAECFETK